MIWYVIGLTVACLIYEAKKGSEFAWVLLTTASFAVITYVSLTLYLNGLKT